MSSLVMWRSTRLVWRCIIALAGLLLACGRLEASAAAQESAPPPNIILIVADDLGYGELGCYGQKIIRTPSIDRLAAEGIRFTQHYSGSPVCAPSRCTLLTGKHTGHAFIRDNGDPPDRPHDEAHDLFPGQYPLPDAEVTLAEVLRRCGYVCGAIGKWGLGYEGSAGDPSRRGFNLFFGYLCQYDAHNHYPRFLWRNGERIPLEGNDRKLSGRQYSQDLFVREALQFIRDNKGRLFFLYLPVIVPHLSIQVPEETLAEYRGKIAEADYVHRGYLQHPSPRAGYAAMITHMDRGIGKIMELLGELGLDERTIVVFTSDNGPTYDRLGGSDSAYFESAGPLRGLKGSVYEGGIRVPLVVRWTGKIAPSSVSDHVCAFWDHLPTLGSVAGATLPAGLDGVSFSPTLLGQGEQREHQYLYWEFPAYGGQQAVRLGRWKGVRQDISKGNMKLELYDLQTDPGEQHDVAAGHPDIVQRIEQIMREAHTDSALFPLFPEVAPAAPVGRR
ncbi:MAG: arylsulfatase [Planctomycetota bacterium]